MPPGQGERRLPVGAEYRAGEGTHFRVWAPRAKRVGVRLEGTLEPGAVPPGVDGPPPPGEGPETRLHEEGDGYFSAWVAEAGRGTLYRYRLDGAEDLHPDPASRWQPAGPHGSSCVVDPDAHAWSDRDWPGVGADGRSPVIYEMHVGTFTAEGTWEGARARLPHLAELGVTVLELMPVSDFPGRFGWGYDGVGLFAPYHGYGTPADFRRFVDAAHGVGLAVILDVVYNHLGPDGNYLGVFSDHYASRRHRTDWGPALNFDGEHSAPVREWCTANVRHWIREYRLDGFRFDATQDLHDDSPEHILKALAREARSAAGERRILLLAENEPQWSHLALPPEEGGFGLDMIGNDDYHHTAVAALTGVREAYYQPYLGTPQEFVSAAKHGFLYQGQWYPWQGKRRGTSSRRLPAGALAHYLENHDQVANGGLGLRLHQVASPGNWRALVALTLLGPQTPFLFQGQEFRSSAPFLYFADQPEELAALTWKGRFEFLKQFRNVDSPGMKERIGRPADPETFRRSQLDWAEREKHVDALHLHRDLLRVRHEDGPLSAPGRTVDGAVLGPHAFVLRGFGASADGSGDRLLLVNLGVDLFLSPAPEPLLAPPTPAGWSLLWSSEDPRYGGRGTPPVETETWNLPGGSALLLRPASESVAEPAEAGRHGRENRRRGA